MSSSSSDHEEQQPPPQGDADQQAARQRKRVKKLRPWLMATACIVASSAYRARLNPPGGPNAGQPVTLSLLRSSFHAFNSTVLAASLLLAVLVSRERFYRTPARMAALKLLAAVDLAAFVAAFAVAAAIC